MIAVYVVSAALLAAAFLYAGKRFRQERPRVQECPTVEAEQANSYAVAAHGNHWNGVTTEVPLEHDYSYNDLCDDTPESVLVFLSRKHKARLQ